MKWTLRYQQTRTSICTKVRRNILTVFAISAFLFILTGCGGDTSGQATDTSENSKVEISMEEAIALGMEEAEKYGVNLKLTEVHSYDNDSERYIDAGEDGQRQWWYVSFANEELNYLDVLICNGELYRVQFLEANGNNGLIEIDDVQMTAQEAVQEAKEMGLRGGDPDNEEEEWVSGFNFKLEYASLASDPDNDIIFLEVIGISPNGNFAHVDFDAATGELLIVEEETADGWSEWGTTDVQDDDMEVEQETELYQVTPSEPGNEMLTALIDIGLEYQVLLATDKVYEDGVNENPNPPAMLGRIE